MNRYRAICALSAGLVMSASWTGLVPPSYAQDGKGSVLRIGDMAWLNGHWQGKSGTSVFDEIWTPPAGNNMLGMFRITKADKLVMYEFMTLQDDPSGVTLRMRHFDAKLVAREEKEKALVWKAASWEKNQATFRLQDGQHKESLHFQRVSSSELAITLEKEQNGKMTRQPFSFKLVGSN